MYSFIAFTSITWFAYEILCGIQVVRNHFKEGKKQVYVPPTLLHSKGREQYEEWKEWKGDRFD